jgi:hypothetical protein
MPRNGTDRQDEGQKQDDGLEQGDGSELDGELEGMAVEVSSNQIRNEDIPASHHEEKGQRSVVQNEQNAHRSAHHDEAASSRDENSGN